MIGKSKSGLHGNSIIGRNALVHDTKSWAFGGDVSYTYGDQVFKIGAEYIDNLKTRQLKSFAIGNGRYTLKDNKAGKVWAVAGSYKLGSHKIAYGYFNSKRDMGKIINDANNTTTNLGTAKADVHSITYDKDMAPGWSLYSEFNRFRFRTTQNAVTGQNVAKVGTPTANFDDGVKGTHGHSVIVGTKIKF